MINAPFGTLIDDEYIEYKAYSLQFHTPSEHSLS